MRKIQMSLREETIKDIEYLKTVFNTQNNADAMVKAVKLAKKLANEILAGNSVIIERGWFEADSKLSIR